MKAPNPNPRPLDHVLSRGLPDAPALVTKSETLSYAQCEKRVAGMAGALAGCVPGSRVATWLPKTIDACLMPLAAARAGLVHIPINPMLRRAQVAHILSDSGAVILLTNAERLSSLEEGDLPEGCFARLEIPEGTAMPPSRADPEALAAILYTSGSTGRPKGVMLSHANLWLGAVSVAHYLNIQPQDRTLAILPLGFDYGQNQLFSTWYGGGCVVPFDYLFPGDVVRAVLRHRITTLAAVPPLWLQLVEQNWGEAGDMLRRVTNSGGALTPVLIEGMKRAFARADIYPMYGLTEAFRSTYLSPDLVASHPGSIGREIPFAEVMVVDEAGKSADKGELVHAGPLVTHGYWGDDVMTALRFRPAPSWSRYGGTAVWSGDTVERDADGLLYFVGRQDEMIKSSGHRISPQEIEEAAVSSGSVVEAVAHAVADERLGQAIRLVVRGRADDDALLRRHLKARLPSHMQPRIIEWRTSLPLNANGKIDRAAIRAEVTS